MADLRRRRDAASDADVVELRLDSVADPDVAGALQGRQRPVVLTCRTPREGGLFRGSEDERRAILRAAVLSDAEYVDLEWASGLDALVRLRQGRGIVWSSHDFSGVPRDLVARIREMAGCGADIVKVAVAVTRLSDVVRLLEVAREMGPARRVLIGMGDVGRVTRICAARFGSEWSYAGEGVAPGQVGVASLLREFSFRRVTAATAIYGLVGLPIGHSVSPAMHNAGFAELGVDAVYVPLPAADVDDLRSFAEAFALEGASVTAPYKEAALALADLRDEIATQVGAANTLTWRDGRVRASNTDVSGFLASLSAGNLGPAAAWNGRRAAVLGAGGAARAVIVALQSAGVAVTVYGRDDHRTREAAAGLGAAVGSRPVPPGSWDLLVNATPVGTYPAAAETPFPEARFDGLLVSDLVYNPPDTRLMRDARAAGCPAIGGLEMLVAQAVGQQAQWTGRPPTAHTLRAAARWKLTTFVGTL